MATYTLKQAPKVWKNRIKNIKKGGRRAQLKASSMMIKLARKHAPRKSGATMRGIRRRNVKKISKGTNITVESWVPGAFKQNLFANRTPPYDTINFTTSSLQRYYAIPQRVTYGRAAISPSGNQIRWTGDTSRVGGFWNIALSKVRKEYPKFMVRNTRKALRVGL